MSRYETKNNYTMVAVGRKTRRAILV